MIRRTIELTQAPVFEYDFHENLPFLVLEALGGDEIHRASLPLSPSSIKDLAPRLQKKIARSDIQITPSGVVEWQSVILKTPQTNFIVCGQREFSVYGRKKKLVERLARRLQSMVFENTNQADLTGYTLIKKTTYGVEHEFVPLSGVVPGSDMELALLYGDDILEWREKFQKRIWERKSGISILEGPPGCGKSSFLRGFIAANALTHRFYFIAAHDLCMLSDPDFVTVWSVERKKFEHKKLVLIIEDAEQALFRRENDNRTIVSTLLNYTDGLLSDHLRMQVICTINCKASDLDSAIMRPGRLMTHRIFKRLSAKAALKVAEFKGIDLRRGEKDYSLAEIFHEVDETSDNRSRAIGFAA